MTRGGSLAAFAAFGVFWGGWAVVLPDVKEATGASVESLGVALLAIAAAALPSMVLTGRLIDRFGPSLLPVAAVLFAVAVLLPGLATSVWQLALALAVVGAASGALDVAINFGATSIEACGGAPIMQKAHASFSAGFLVASVLVGVAREVGAGPLPILAAAAAVVLAAAWANRRAGAYAAPTKRGGRRVALTRPLVVLGLLCAIAFVVESGIEQWSALFLETELDASPGLAGLGPAFFAAAMVLGRSVGQAVETRTGEVALLVAGGLLAAGGLATAASASSIAVGAVGFFCGGAGISVAAPALFGAAGRGTPEGERGSALASVTTLSYLGFLGGPPLVGVVSGAIDLRAGIALLAAAAALLAFATASLGGALPLRRVQPAARRGLPES